MFKNFKFQIFFLISVATLLFVTGLFFATKFSNKHYLESNISPKSFLNLENRQIKRVYRTQKQGDVGKKKQIRVAIAPVFSPELSLKLYENLVNHLGEKLDMEPVIVLRQTYTEVNELVRDQLCELAFVCAFPFIRGERDFGMELLVIPVINGKSTYCSYIIKSKRVAAKSLMDFKNRTFASPTIFSNSGWLFPAYWLSTKNINPKTFFSNHIITGSHDNSIHAVMNGYADGAAVHSIVYEQLLFSDSSVAKTTDIILKSDEFGMPPVVVSPNLDTALKKRLQDIFLNLHKSSKGKNVISVLRIEKFILTDSKKYNSVRKAEKVWSKVR